MNFISCVKWVKQGAAKAEPDNVHLNEEELQQLLEEADNDPNSAADDDDDNDDDKCSTTASTDQDEYDFKNYDEADDFRVTLKGIAEYDKSRVKSKKRHHDDSDDSDKEDDLIKEDDNLLLVGHVENDFNTLEVYVYNENDGDMYIHHDLVLGSPPLCVQWLSMETSSGAGNVCAIGSMEPIIEVWDLDIVNSVEPVFKLGRHKKKNPHKNNGHTDAVLCLAWNTELRHILSSGSVDNRVLMWDLDAGTVHTEITTFADKVQTLAWNPRNAYSLLGGGADRYVRDFDCRVYDQFQECDLRSAVESILWDESNEHLCYAGTEAGVIYCVDWRTGKSVWEVAAHEKEVTGLSMYAKDDRKLLISVSTDECMKLWDVSKQIRSIGSKDLKLRSLHCMDINPNYPHLACVGGSSESNDKTLVKVVNIDNVLKPKTHATSAASIDAVTNRTNALNEFNVPLLEENDEAAPEVPSESGTRPAKKPHKKKLRRKLEAEKAKKMSKKKLKFRKNVHQKKRNKLANL